MSRFSFQFLIFDVDSVNPIFKPKFDYKILQFNNDITKSYTFSNFDQTKSFYFMTMSEIRYKPTNSIGFYVNLLSNLLTGYFEVNIDSKI
jgi:hypothetical protein